MSPASILELAERLQRADPSQTPEQREIFERIRELRSAFDGPLDPESHRHLEAASMLVAYLARMGSLAGEDVRTIAVRLLRSAAAVEDAALGKGPATTTLPTDAPMTRIPARPPTLSSEPPPEVRSAVETLGEMMLGQILLQRGQILEEHIHQALKVQRATSARLGDVLVKIGACSRAQVQDALNHQVSLRRLGGSLPEPSRKTLEKVDTRGTGLKLVGEVMLGEILVEQRLISRRQLERALEAQKATGQRIGEILVKLGATTAEQIEQALKLQGRDRRFGNKPSG